MLKIVRKAASEGSPPGRKDKEKEKEIKTLTSKKVKYVVVSYSCYLTC